MHVEIKSEAHHYHVSFEQNRSKKFKKGPNKGRPQTVTECNIFLLTDPEPTLVNKGVTVLGPKDDDDSYIGCKEAFTRALETTYFNKRETTMFWEEFRKQHLGNGHCGSHEKLVEAAEELNNKPVHGYGGSHSFHMRRILTVGNPNGNDQCHKHDGGPVYPSVYGLGWTRLLPKRTKDKQLAAMYNGYGQKYRYGYGCYGRAESVSQDFVAWNEPHETIIPKAEAKGRCRRVGQNVTIINTTDPADNDGDKRIREIISGANSDEEQRIREIISDDRLSGRMLAMSLASAEQARKVDEQLLKRPGIAKVNDLYMINFKKFVPIYEVGETVTYMNGKAKVLALHGPMVTLRRFGNTYSDVFDHELKKRPSWLRRAWSWVSRIEPDADSLRKPPASSGLWQMIYDNHCVACHDTPHDGFLRGPHGGVRCSACGQKYWIDPLSQTAKKIQYKE